MPDPAQRVGSTSEVVGMSLIAGCLGVTAAAGYEIYEWVVDHWFGQHLFIGETDTITDLADGFLGGAVGGTLLAVWAIARYTSRRLRAESPQHALRRAQATTDGLTITTVATTSNAGRRPARRPRSSWADC